MATNGDVPNAELTFMYRGQLSSCNYDCCYCPFAKKVDSKVELDQDRQQVERFVRWVTERSNTAAVFFTPWGEALVRPWYRQAVQKLTQQDHIVKVTVQTNLAYSLGWLDKCSTGKLGLWCTYHPSQVDRSTFLTACYELTERGVSYSVGMVGLPDDYAEINAMRAELPADTYMWINAWEVNDGQKYNYSETETAMLETVDPHFATNTVDYPSLGKACATGTKIVSVNGDGHATRCHFVDAAIGNIYDEGFETQLVSRLCPNKTCGCHIGYIHLDELQLNSVYGEKILERVPVSWSTGGA